MVPWLLVLLQQPGDVSVSNRRALAKGPPTQKAGLLHRQEPKEGARWLLWDYNWKIHVANTGPGRRGMHFTAAT